MPDAGPDPLTLHDVGIGTERILAAIAEMRAAVDVIAARLDRERIASPPRLQASVGRALVVEIHDYAGNAVWTCAELLDETKRDARLAVAVQAAIGPLDGGACRRLGRLLQRLDGAVLGDCRLERTGECRDGALWSVMRV